MSDNIKLNYKINTIPSLTWNWLKMNSDTISSEAVTADFSEYKPTVNKVPDGITIYDAEIPVSSTGMTNDAVGMTNDGIGMTNDVSSSEIANDVSLSGLTRQSFASGIFNIANKKMPDSRVDDEKTESEQKSQKKVIHPLEKVLPEIKGQTIKITGKTTEPLILNFSGADTTASKNTLSAQTILAEKDSEATIIFVYEDETSSSPDTKSATAAPTPSTQIISTKIIAGENAKLHIVKVQLLGNNALQLDDTAFLADDNAKLQFTQIELGGKHVDSGLHVNLNGYKSSFKSNVAYICKKDQYLDMNHIVYHYGKKSECDMQVEGTLEDSSIKTYRGTIDFKNGCAGSKGNEMEEVLLLSPKAVNKSLPVILCDEEDVEGEHGSTIGKLSKEMLFYMQTKGISQAEAEKLLSKAKIQFAADFIPSEEIKEKIRNWIGD